MCAIQSVAQLCLTLRDPVDGRLPGSSMEFSRQEYWNGLPFPPPGDRPDPGIKRASFMSLALAGGFFITSATWEAPPSPKVLSCKTLNVLLLCLFFFMYYLCKKYYESITVQYYIAGLS